MEHTAKTPYLLDYLLVGVRDGVSLDSEPASGYCVQGQTWKGQFS